MASGFKINLRSRLGSFRALEVGLWTKAEELGKEERREALRLHIVRANTLVVIPSCRGNSILGSLKLRHKIPERLGRLELRVGLDCDEQSEERRVGKECRSRWSP